MPRLTRFGGLGFTPHNKGTNNDDIYFPPVFSGFSTISTIFLELLPISVPEDE